MPEKRKETDRMTLVASDAWEDLGSREKPVPALNPYRHFKSPPRHDREAESTIEARRTQNLFILEQLKVLAEYFAELNGCVHMKIKGKAFDFYPSTGCWFSYAKNVYGTGIDKIKEIIFEKLGPS